MIEKKEYYKMIWAGSLAVLGILLLAFSKSGVGNTDIIGGIIIGYFVSYIFSVLIGEPFI